MTRTASWLAAVLVLCPLGAQDTPAKTSAEERRTQLEAEQKKIVEAWQQQRQDAAKAVEEAKKSGKPIPALSMRPDFSPLVSQYLAAADEFPGDDAVQFLMPALNMSPTPEGRRTILERLLADHMDSPQLSPLGSMLQYLDRMVSPEFATEARAQIKARCKNPDLIAWLAFADNESVLRTSDAKSPEFAAAKSAVETALAKADAKDLERQFHSMIKELEQFGIGMVAPDIAGVDLDGVEFKLSDYQGKVVFLDFWGDW